MVGKSISVPDLVGFGWEEAREIAQAAGLRPRAIGPDGQAVNGKGGVVIDQQPTASGKASRGADLALRIAFGGGPAGDREPRKPRPDPHEFEEWADRLGESISTSHHDDREPALAGSAR